MEVGGLRVASIVDRIDGPSSWTIERDVHALILYEAGSYHWLETWLDDQRTSLGDPLPGEMWLVPAGHIYRGAAKGGGVRTIEVEIPAALLTVAPDTRALAAHHDLALAAQWADRIVMLHAGRTHAEGRPDQVLTPDLLAQVYGVEARVERCSQGRIMVLIDGEHAPG